MLPNIHPIQSMSILFWNNNSFLPKIGQVSSFTIWSVTPNEIKLLSLLFESGICKAHIYERNISQSTSNIKGGIKDHKFKCANFLILIERSLGMLDYTILAGFTILHLQSIPPLYKTKWFCPLKIQRQQWILSCRPSLPLLCLPWSLLRVDPQSQMQ